MDIDRLLQPKILLSGMNTKWINENLTYLKYLYLLGMWPIYMVTGDQNDQVTEFWYETNVK